MAATNAKDAILDAAERRARVGGYHGFSFRDVAADVGIKSASVHYHFPTKAALATALTERYAARARAAIGAPETRRDAFDRIAAIFRAALLDDELMCLCGLFGAERDTAPTEVSDATAAYFRMLIETLGEPKESDGAALSAATIVSTLEGALITARSLSDPALFDRIAAEIRPPG